MHIYSTNRTLTLVVGRLIAIIDYIIDFDSSPDDRLPFLTIDHAFREQEITKCIKTSQYIKHQQSSHSSSSSSLVATARELRSLKDQPP